MQLLRNFVLIALCAMGTPALAKVRTDLPNKAMIAELDGTEIIDPSGKEINWHSDDDMVMPLKCNPANPTQLSYAEAEGKKWAACCLPGQQLMGSPSSAFDCCSSGHELVGAPNGKYRCCPTGQIFDGTICKPPPVPEQPACSPCSHTPPCHPPSDAPGHPPSHHPGAPPTGGNFCPNGKPSGPDGKCQCDSGLSTSSCFLFTMENGKRLGFTGAYYAAGDASRAHQFGKFKLCKDEECTAGSPINPGDKVHIKNIHGNPNGGANPNQWLNNAKNGDHISNTGNFAQAGAFTLTKWPCGKYCLGGVDAGIGSTCPSEQPAMTFATADKQVCMPVTLTEVPCDVKDAANNCIWDTAKKQCCSDNECKISSKHTEL